MTESDIPKFDRRAEWTVGRLFSLALVALFVGLLLVGIFANIPAG